MNIPDYWLKRPQLHLKDEVVEHFERFYEKVISQGDDCAIEDNLVGPKWLFLTWLVDNKAILLHGSGNTTIKLFEPRLPDDRSPDAFSKQKAVFAASDGIWSIFYAIVDRQNFKLRMLNGALQFQLETGLSEMRYFFSITEPAFGAYPFRQGAVYMLPKESFKQQLRTRLASWTVQEPQWASAKAVKPLAKLSVEPQDFPLLQKIRSHKEVFVEERSSQDPYGFPWLDP